MDIPRSRQQLSAEHHGKDGGQDEGTPTLLEEQTKPGEHKEIMFRSGVEITTDCLDAPIGFQ